MTLELEPKNLGRLSLRIETHQNNVSAFISTDNEQAKALLLQHSASLRQHLEDQGLQLGQLFVEVREEGSGSRQSFRHEGSEKREGGTPQGAKSLDKSEWDAVSAVYGRKTGHQLISLFA
jgi:flagellar hook-length control protein FliK